MAEVISFDLLQYRRRIGETMFCETQQRTIVFKCIDVIYHEHLGKYVYVGITKFGNMARLTENEVYFKKGI